VLLGCLCKPSCEVSSLPTMLLLAPKVRRVLDTVDSRDVGNSHDQTYGEEAMGGGLGARTTGRGRG
jgi:hypothetical protein